MCKCSGPSVLVYLTGAIIGLGGWGEIKHGLRRQHSMHLQLTSHPTSLRFLWNSATGWMFIYECLFICFYLNILRRIIILTKNFQYRCNGLSTCEESITLVSPIEKKRYAYHNKRANSDYLKSTKTKKLWVWSFYTFDDFLCIMNDNT